MTLPRSLLVAVDFGEASAQAVVVGGLIAERCRAATLRLMHAESIEAPPYFTSEQVEGLERQRHALESQAQQFLTRFGRQHTTVPFVAVVDGRPPVEAVLHASASADLVVMGTHGRHGAKRWWLGSVAERIVRDIARPLLVVRDIPAASTFQRIVVEAAPPLVGAQTMQYARELAACFGGEPIDGRHQPGEAPSERARATVLAVAMPTPRTAAWLSHFGEPLVRSCHVPVLFVPEDTEGASR